MPDRKINKHFCEDRMSEDVPLTTKKGPKWDLVTKNLLKSLFDCVLQGKVKDFALVVEMSEADDRIFYKSSGGKKLVEWAAEKKDK